MQFQKMELQTGSKTCIKCNSILPLTDFHKTGNQCKSCVKEYKRDYNQKNKAVIAEKEKRYREENKEKIQESRRKYRSENNEKIVNKKKIEYERNRDHYLKYKKEWYNNNKPRFDKELKLKSIEKHARKTYANVIQEFKQRYTEKLCKACKKIKLLLYFINSVTNSKETVNCNECRQKKSVNANKNNEYIRRHQKLREYRKQLKQKGKCVDCGIDDWRVLEFDHIDPSLKENQVSHCSSIDKITSEAAKCELRCCFCHRIKTVITLTKDTNTYKEKAANNRLMVNNYKLSQNHCEFCERQITKINVFGFDLDHMDPKSKSNNVSSMLESSKEKVLEELKKTRLLCANCHRIHTLISLHNKDGFYTDKHD